MPTRVGLFGGTFNPPHKGHVAVLKAAARLGRFDLLEVTVAGDPYQKRDPSLLSGDARLAMARAAFEGLSLVEVSDRELRRAGPTYTIDTVEELRADFDAVDLIIGADLAGQISSWHRADELATLVEVGVVPRPGDDQRIGPAWRGYRIPMSPVDLSSTYIRDLEPTRADLDDLLPASVVPLYIAYRG
ncbi:MAG TPA: nicotinate (nicotinamide) nucleotide adenylyltransferase [Acidimicrobiales bacterium]|nr:nicotinate (nicotinamide) nucleotide adenylyltransferase [Acidimicrobiales bacterium]